MEYRIDLNRLKRELTKNEVINIIRTIDPDVQYEEFGDEGIVLPTICHNIDSSSASKKLYYYFNDDPSNPEAAPLFCCYTECGHTFDIYELVKKMLGLRNLPNEFTDVFNIITRNTDKIFQLEESTDKYSPMLQNYHKKNRTINFNIYRPGIVQFFPQYFYEGWIKEGISVASMRKYGIRFSPSKNQIIIPHYNLSGDLIGIRGRNLNEIDLLNGNKYMPVKIEGKWYSHSLSYNLYGLYENQEAIKRKKIAFIFEGEKSVLMCDGWYGEDNVAVATCGNKLNKIQLDLLLKLGVQQVVLCYDRMNDSLSSDYFNHLHSICTRYKNYMTFSFIYDRDKLLEYKAAPVDSGKEVFEKLLSQRVAI